MNEEDPSNLKSRDFICACGKNYLSYAALFTHIKQKHEGKAPGPIIRPRSERKRGRPRKNPLNESEQRNSDSDNANNGISSVKDINNNIPSSERKTKKAAEQLGCLQFGAFQTYRLQPLFGSHPLPEKQSANNLSLKRALSNQQKALVSSPKHSSSPEKSPEIPFQHTKSAPPSNLGVAPDSEYSLLLTQHLNSIFSSYQENPEEENCRQVIKLYTETLYPIKSTQRIRNKSQINGKSKNKIKVEEWSIEQGLSEYLSEVSETLNSAQYTQISFLLAMFQEHISEENGNLDSLSGISFSEITKYTVTFLYQNLPLKIKDRNLGHLHIMKQINATNLILNLCNWLSLKQSQHAEPQKSSIDKNKKNNKEHGDGQVVKKSSLAKGSEDKPSKKSSFTGFSKVSGPRSKDLSSNLLETLSNLIKQETINECKHILNNNPNQRNSINNLPNNSSNSHEHSSEQNNQNGNIQLKQMQEQSEQDEDRMDEQEQDNNSGEEDLCKEEQQEQGQGQEQGENMEMEMDQENGLQPDGGQHRQHVMRGAQQQ